MNTIATETSPRIKVKDLGTSVKPVLHLAGQSLELYEIGPETLTAFGANLPELSATGLRHPWRISLDGELLSEGSGEIVRTAPAHKGLRLELEALSAPVDLTVIAQRAQQADYRAQLRAGVAATDALVPAGYKAFCAEVNSTLRGYRRLAEQIDRDAAAAGADARAPEEVFEECAARFIADWTRFGQLGTPLCEPLMDDPVRVAAMRAFTHRVVTPEMLPGAVWRRAFEKPRGYPGDYGVMNYFYEWKDIGASTYARLCHRVGLAFAACVRTRKDLVRRVLLEKLSQGQALRTTSIACGSAQEIHEIALHARFPGPYTVTLLDQDPEALKFAMDRLRVPLAGHGSRLIVDARPAHFGDFTDRQGAVPGEQDLIYCFGMFDYLHDNTIAQITLASYTKLRSGGSLILGNLKASSETKWGLRFVLGYDMWFRTEAQMLALAQLCPGARAELRLEETGHNYLLFIHKP